MDPDEFGGEDFDTPSDDSQGDLASTWNGLAADKPAPEPVPDIEPPTSWPKERKARWSSLSPEDRAYIAQREREAHSRISQQGEELARLRAEHQRAFAGDEKYDQYQNEITSLRAKYEEQLAEIARRDQIEMFNQWAADKPYCRDEGFQRQLAAEMRAILAEAPGLKGTMLLKLAHDQLAERIGIPKHYEQQRQQQLQQQQQQREQEIQQLIAERDAQWQAKFLQYTREQDAQRAKEAAEKTRAAKRAASVNLGGSPGQGRSSSPKSVDDTLREVANRLYNES